MKKRPTFTMSATITGKLDGKRVFRGPFTFQVSAVELDFLPAREGVPTQARITVEGRYGYEPRLVVQESLTLVHTEATR